MKTRSDPRHLKRIKLMQELFAWNFQDKNLVSKDARVVVDNLKTIDPLISQSAPDRPINQINKVDLAILRLSVFEIIMKKDAPTKVVIDEAVELGKEFGSESSPAFINGVLGQLIKTEKIDI